MKYIHVEISMQFTSKYVQVTIAYGITCKANYLVSTQVLKRDRQFDTDHMKIRISLVNNYAQLLYVCTCITCKANFTN